MTAMMAVVRIAAMVAATLGQSTGYPQCDRFIQVVSECIKTKLPPPALLLAS
jgi:hypothetical protein